MDENLKFNPLTASQGNVDGEVARLRDIFLNAEMEYFMELLKDEEILKMFISLLDYPPNKLYEEATKRIDAIENGMVEEGKLERVEGEITLLLAAIQDKVRIRELIKTMSIENENNLGNGRGL